MTVKNIFSIYGSIGIMKQYCEDCKRYGFVIDGRLQCCEKKAEPIADNFGIRREIEPDGKRRKPSKSKQQAILEKQDYKCTECPSLW